MNARTVQLVRSVSIIGGTAALIAGVTFAAFTSNSVTLADNQLTVDTHVLSIWNGSTFADAAPGFSSSLVPNVEGDKKAFYLKNVSGANLGLSARLSDTPGLTNVADTGVHVRFFDEDGNELRNYTLAQLASSQPLLGQLNAGAQGDGNVADTEGNYSYSLKVDAAAVTGNSGSVNNIDFEFTGTAL